MPALKTIVMNFDSHISKITYSSDNNIVWNTSGESQNSTFSEGSVGLKFYVILDSGYIIDTVTADRVNVTNISDTEFTVSDNFTTTATITVTSKQSGSTYYIISKEELTAIADAVRTKAETTNKLTPSAIAETINNIEIVTPIATEAAMDALLIEANNGKAFEYTGTTTSKYINGDIYVVTSEVSTETWVLNETLNDTTLSGTDNYYIGGSFISNSEKYIGLHRSYNTKTMECFLIYGNDTSGTVAKQVYEDLSTATWTNQAYRTITFDSPVTDTTLLAWLQANGTKQ